MDRKSDASLVETVVTHTSAPAAEEGRFVPGTLLGGRYRIIGLLGRGGMGEVYRATDLMLGQSVALKFLPEEAARNPRLLERFHGEVRVARQVSHPNVCRVYDIGEAEGMPFISMEYVDGEDLASLLLRIGRLPADKAVETARKICAGLAAAHGRGIIHRDLKPQNIMLNKRGEVVIMDFGLAAIADQLSGAEVRNGTPAYMAPEQLKGAEVTTRSDIYALGLVLYELFTGKRPYDAKTVAQLLDLQESAKLTSMTSIAADIDEAVEKAIRRCLDPDPARRPPSALAVSAALPGGDPLAAALAAGETPSPELVASAGETQGMARKYSVPCLAVVILCLFASTLIRDRNYAMMHAPLDYPPEVLGQKAREVAASLGYPRKPVDAHLSLQSRDALISYLKKIPEPRRWDEWLAAEAPIRADYRESPSPLFAWPFGEVTTENPAPLKPGMARVILDGNARLREFSAVPYAGGQELAEPVAPETIFRAAGLDMKQFTETTPGSLPPSASDQLRAWKGPHPKIPNTELAVEMASWKGRVTLAKVAFPWERTAAAAKPAQSLLSKSLDMAPLAMVVAFLAFVVLLARRNWTLGRTDRKGALRIAIARFLLAAVVWMGTVQPLPSGDMLFLFYNSLGDWLMSAALVWLLYLGLEPAVRSRWPHSIVSWNRILAGRWRDPLVASHVLIGAAVGCGLWVSAESIQAWLGPRNMLDSTGSLSLTLGARQWIAAHAGTLGATMTGGLMIFFVIFGLRLLLRKEVLAAIVAALLSTAIRGDVINSPDWRLLVPIYVGLMTILVFILLRVGLVTTISAMFFLNSSNAILLGADWKTWYAPWGLATLLLLLAIALFAFWRSLGSRGLLGGEEIA